MSYTENLTVPVFKTVCAFGVGAIGTACSAISLTSNLMRGRWAEAAFDAVGAFGGSAAARAMKNGYKAARKAYNRTTKHYQRSGNPAKSAAARGRNYNRHQPKWTRRAGGYMAEWAGGKASEYGARGAYKAYKKRR